MVGVIRINGKTPNGGDYSEAYYFDKNRNLVEPEKAADIMINEYKRDGTLIGTTYAKVEEQKESG